MIFYSIMLVLYVIFLRHLSFTLKFKSLSAQCLLQSLCNAYGIFCIKMKAEVLVPQSCLTLGNPMDCNLSGSSVHGILQARILVQVSIPFPGALPNPRIKCGSPLLQADSLPSKPPGKPSLLCYPLLIHVNHKFSLFFISFAFCGDFKEPCFVFVDFSAQKLAFFFIQLLSCV